MARTLTGLLVGIAVSEGAIHSIDDTAATYVPEMAGTEYGATPLRALLHMSSGVAFREQTYEPDEDIINLHKALLGKDAVGAIAALRQFTRVTRRRIRALPMPVLRQRCSGSLSAVRSTFRLPTIWRCGLAKARCRVRCRLGDRCNRARSGLLLLHRHATRLGAPRIDVGK
jgi:Beta-lactamase